MAPVALVESGSSPSPKSQSPQTIGTAVTVGGGFGLIYIAIVRAALGGETESLFLYVSPAFTSGVSVLWKSFGFMLTDPIRDWRGKRTYKRARKSLDEVLKRRNLSDQLRRQTIQDREDLDRLFVKDVKDSFVRRMNSEDRH